LGRGLDHAAILVGGDTVVRVALEADPVARAAAVRREAAVLRAVASAVAGVVPVAVPVPSLAEPAAGVMAHPLLPGTPLADVAPAARERAAAPAGATLGRLMSVVAGLTPRVGDVVHVDADPPAEWLAEARAGHPRVEDAIPPARRAAVRAFLDAEPPAPADGAHLVLCHDDLGAEHVLVDGAGTVTGVIDWSDAAIADPAGDLGRILRDLGPAALDAALAELAPPEPRATRARTVFRARCGALEDMAYGRDADRPAYVSRAVAALGWLFG
jgi:aminoglycoside phosphotransferase (APT) family kinase protein